MYRKVQENNETLAEPPGPPPPLIPPEQQQSFWACPSCQGTRLVQCPCDRPNYLCQNCGWTHLTHHHQKPKKPKEVYGKPSTKLLHPYTLPN